MYADCEDNDNDPFEAQYQQRNNSRNLTHGSEMLFHYRIPSEGKMPFEVCNNKLDLNQLEQPVPDLRFQEESEEFGNLSHQDDIQRKNNMVSWEDHFDIPMDHIRCSTTQMNEAVMAYQLQISNIFQDNEQVLEKQQKSRPNDGKAQLTRRMRVQRYLVKRARRSFIKKISYQCRKTVANSRMRIKGRFVNKKVAEEIIRCSHQPLPWGLKFSQSLSGSNNKNN